MSVKELALLELEFLVRVQWRIVPVPEVLGDYYRSLVGRTVGYVLEGQEENGHDTQMHEPTPTFEGDRGRQADAGQGEIAVATRTAQ